MKIRLTLLTENNSHVDLPKEVLEQKAKEAWETLLNLICLNGDDKAILEKCEVVEM